MTRSNKNNRWTGRRWLIAVAPMMLLLVVPLNVGCQMYQLGAPSMYRQDIATVHVPMVESNSFRKFLGQRMTEAICKEVEDETTYRLADAAVADSILRARIVRESKRAAGENRFDDVRDVQIDWLVEVTWTDRMGTPLMERQLLRIDRHVNFVPEGGQSMVTAQQELIDRIARQIVDQMEMPW